MSVNLFRKEYVPENKAKIRKKHRNRKPESSVSERFLTAMELPGDLACKAPIITITGQTQVLIENYKSILSYTSDKLTVVTCQGRVILQGKNLEITRYTALEMEVKGKITAVMLETR